MKNLVFALLLLSLAAHSYEVTGSIHKSNRGEYMNVDLAVVSTQESLPQYELKGPASSNKGFITTTLGYNGVKVYRIENGMRRVIPNNAQMTLAWGDRQVSGQLMGLPVSGSFYQGVWGDDKIEFNNLTVNQISSQGVMDYNSLNGRYNAKDGLKFGACSIAAINSSEKEVMNYDDYLGQNSMVIKMKFCDLIIEGRINYSDDVRRSCDEDGCTDNVLATTGYVNLSIKKDGVEFSEVSSEDDANIRLFLAFIQLMAFDTFSE